MEGLKVEKRVALNDSDTILLEPVLVKIDKRDGIDKHDAHDICIDKNEFKIGRARDNDEIILNTMISRRHCIFRCEGNDEWTIKDLSSSTTFVNDVPVTSGSSRTLSDGDVIQLSNCEEFRYVFTLDREGKRPFKKPRIDNQIYDNVLIEQKTFAQSQECQKRVLKDKLQTKQKEQDELKLQLKELLKQKSVAKEDTEDLKKQIIILEEKIKSGNVQEQHIKQMYNAMLKKLETERIHFEKRLNDEKEKWQEALNVSKLEKEMLEMKMKEQMEKWREEQQTEWKNVMENIVKEEKDKQTLLLNEKTVLEEKLKETMNALNEQTAKVETIQSSVPGTSENTADSCIFLEIVNDPMAIQIIDTIDLTAASQIITTNNEEKEEKETILNKVNDIMDEQLTCSICSELFIKPTTLNCTHTFCQHCIKMWNKKKKECAVCRAPVSSMNRSLVLDNFIDSILENLPNRFKEKRQELIEERKALELKKVPRSKLRKA